MKNLIDSKIGFSVISDDSLMQTYTLDSGQVGIQQLLMAQPSALYVLQEPQPNGLDTLVAKRSGEDLLLAFRAEEQARPALTLDQFFANNGRLHVLKQDGELLRAIMGEDNPQQGPVEFDMQAPSAAEQQMISPVLGLLLPASETASASAATVEDMPHTDATAVVQLAALNLAPLSVEPPRITQALDQVGARQGSLASGNVTDDRYATLEGTGTPGVYLEILDNGEVIGEVQVDSNGRWIFEPNQAYSEAGHILTAREQGSGESSTPFVLVVDTIAPSRAFIDSISDDRAGGQLIDRNGLTSDNTPVIKGRAEPFSVVALYAGKVLMGTSFTDASGNWEFSSLFIMPDGEYIISATALDFSGNAGLSSTSYKITVDTIPPAAPTIAHAIDDVGVVQGPLQSGAFTDDRTPTLIGNTEANVTVFVYADDKLLGTTKADANGNWSFTPEQPLDEGQHSFTSRARDEAGNLSELSLPWEVVIDSSAPPKPGIGGEGPGLNEAIDDHGPIQGPIEQGGTTDDSTPTFNGTGEPGDTIIIRDGEVEIGRVEVGSDGNWSFTPDEPLDDGAHEISVIIQKKTGNQSEPSDPWIVVVDTVAPAASAVIESMSKDSGTDSSDFITNNGSAGRLIQGSLTAALGAGEKVQVSTDGGATWLDVLRGSNNTWSFLDHSSYTGDWTIHTRVIDLAGHANVTSQSISLDKVAPDAPNAFAIKGTTVTVTFDGSSLVAGDTIQVTVGSERFEQVLTQAQINAGTVDVITTSGVKMVNTSAAFVDQAGNVSQILSFNAAIVDFENETPSSKKPSDSVDFDLFTFKWDNGKYDLPTYPRGIIAAGTQLGDGYKTSSVGLGIWGGTINSRLTLNHGETASSVTFTYADAGRSGSIEFYDAENRLITSGSLYTNTRGVSKTVSFSMPAGKEFSYFTINLPLDEHIWIDQFEFEGISKIGFETNDPDTAQSIDGNGAYYGGDTDNVFSVSDVAYLDNANSVINGGAGVDTLTLTGAGEILDLGGIAGKLESIEIIDITGTGNNTLKLSLGDLLENGSKNLFLADDNVQLMIKGDAGDKVVLDDLLPNGTDLGDWAAAGVITVEGVAYNTYQHSALNAELLVQQGVTVDLV